MIYSNWLSSNDLELKGCISSEWKTFCRALINTGVQLVEKMYEFKWMGGDFPRQISVKNVYVNTKKKKWNTLWNASTKQLTTLLYSTW